VQIDHTPVDVIVVDEWERQPIGRPWLTLAVDIATRTVPGFYLSLSAPSALSVAMVLNHAVLGKERYLAALGVDVDWPVRGVPKVLHLDNAKEFHSRALMRGCQQHGIEVVHRPCLQPHYGGHIERLIGTIMGEVHLLPGTTFSSVTDRGDYDSGKTAVMTIHELEAWLAWQIPGVYHARNHAALGCPPLQAWNERLSRMPVPPRDPVDPHRFYLDFLPFERRTIGRDGIRLFNVAYWHGALQSYISADGTRYVIRYDPRDMSRVYLAEPGGTYLEVPYRDLGQARVSQRELQHGAQLLRKRGVAAIDENKLFRVIMEQRSIGVDESRSPARDSPQDGWCDRPYRTARRIHGRRGDSLRQGKHQAG
jgi:putative transposase